ncbi:SIMPL domain-containing protein [Aureimonas glaciei]|uniref:SIMPL domain-containing protein n=1 Tax=Aureimonas glaciei TaxID=1776957 RepID=A0A916YCZ0_9HYPH|nr:SIMPL domain-containing protein [Aureimonas glaciei]GGD39917.1 SIMPL domain-containing protein [Aureimonas glaciei]
MLIRAAFLSASMLCLSLASAAAEEARPPRQIVVTGIGEASAKPDIAVTDLTVLRVGETARAALDEANAAMADVVAAMKALSIEDRDLRTSGFSIAPQYRYENRTDGTQAPPILTGYEVRNTLSVRIRDIAAVGALLDKAVSLGINQGGDIAFVLSDPAPVRTEARREAVADAMATAKTLAEASGVELGPVVSIAAGDDAAPPRPMAMERMALAAAPMDKSVPVEAGESTLRTTVTMVFDLTGG